MERHVGAGERHTGAEGIYGFHLVFWAKGVVSERGQQAWDRKVSKGAVERLGPARCQAVRIHRVLTGESVFNCRGPGCNLFFLRL